MSTTFQAADLCIPSQQGRDAYMYTIIPTIENGIAAITSANELLVLDRRSLSTSPVLRMNDIPQNVSCLISGDDIGRSTMCSGSDGEIITHDIRARSASSRFKIDKAVTALARREYQIAVGTELANHQAVVSVWDQRQNKQIWQNAENNDDITALDFHPSNDHMLLAGGDDGQVGIFDISIREEDDSLLQGTNIGPVHKAGFLGNDRFFALTSDQVLSIHSVATAGDSEDPQPILLGDLRPVLQCEYIVDLLQTSDGFAVAAASNLNNSNIKVIELRHAANLAKTPKLKTKSGYMLEGAHGEEVVRSLFADNSSGTIFTAGEDGCIRAFQSSGESITPTKTKGPKSKTGSESRYRPY